MVLQTRSLQLMNIGDPDAKMSFVEHWQGQPLVATTVITCMDTVKQAIDEVGCRRRGGVCGRRITVKLQRRRLSPLIPTLNMQTHFPPALHTRCLEVFFCSFGTRPAPGLTLPYLLLFRPQPDAVSCLVVGTESGRVLILNAAGTAIVKNIWVGITPAMIAVQVCTFYTCARACVCVELVNCKYACWRVGVYVSATAAGATNMSARCLSTIALDTSGACCGSRSTRSSITAT